MNNGLENYKSFEDMSRPNKLRRHEELYDLYSSINKKEYKNILDIGCGDGQLLDMFTNKNTYGIEGNNELALEAINKKHKIIIENINNIDSISQKLIQMFPNSRRNDDKKMKFDLIILSHIVEHLDINIFNNLFILLNKYLEENGSFVIVTPNYKDIRVSNDNFYKDPTHIRPYTENYLKYYISNILKHEIITSKTYNRFIYEKRLDNKFKNKSKLLSSLKNSIHSSFRMKILKLFFGKSITNYLNEVNNAIINIHDRLNELETGYNYILISKKIKEED